MEALPKPSQSTQPEQLCSFPLHLILDNYATHKHAELRASLVSQAPAISPVLHANSSSRMNMVERFFRDLTVDVVRNGSFESAKDLKYVIMDYLAKRNLNSTPY